MRIGGDFTFGCGDVEIAGADDLAYARNAVCAIGKGGHGVRSSDAIELGDAEKVGGGKGLKRGAWRAYDDARNAGDLRGDGGHEHVEGRG